MKKKFFKTNVGEMKEILESRGLFGTLLLERHLEKFKKYITMLANQLAKRGARVDVDDLIQTGYLALYDALQTYRDLKKGCLVTTHCIQYIKWRMSDASGFDRPVEYSLDEEPISDKLQCDEEKLTLLDVIPAPTPSPSQRAEFADLNRAVAELLPRYRAVLTMKYSQGLTFEEIGRELGVKRQRAQQLEKRAIVLLRKKLVA